MAEHGPLPSLEEASTPRVSSAPALRGCCSLAGTAGLPLGGWILGCGRRAEGGGCPRGSPG